MADKSIIDALRNIQTNLKAPKSKRNDFGGYNYRSAEDILEGVKPLLDENGCALYLNDELVLIGDRYYIKAEATLDNGTDRISATAFAREAVAKKGYDESQITGSASSYARKYALNALLAIDDTKDADALNTSAEYTAQTTEKKPKARDKAAFNDLAACTTDAEVVDVWGKYPALHGSEEFRQAVSLKRQSFSTPAQ